MVPSPVAGVSAPRDAPLSRLERPLMPSAYKPRPSDLDHCPPRSLTELDEAAALLGNALVLACDLSSELKLLNVNPSLSSSASGQARQAFGLLQGMLVAERWLIEFLTGPTLQSS